MRILVVGLNFAPEPIGVGKYTGEMVAWLVARGHQVDVITTPPYYPWWRPQPHYGYWQWARETWQGCRVVRCPIYIPKQPTGGRRILHLASFGITSLPVALYRALSQKPDVVYGIVPTLFSAPVALIAARLSGAKACLHIQDLEIDAGASLVVGHGFRRFALALESWLLRRFDLVSSISAKMLEAIAQKGVNPSRLELFPNWVKTSVVFPTSPSQKARQDLGIPDDRCIAMYSGSMGAKQGLETVLAAARILERGSEQSPLFILAGEGHARERLEAQAQGLSNVRFLAVVPHDRFNEFLNLGDIHLLPQTAAIADLVLPSKLYAILAVGKPVVATTLPETQLAEAIGDAGSIVAPGDVDALAQAISKLAADPMRRQQMGTAALLKARTNYEGELVLGRMEARLMHEVSATVPPQTRPAHPPA